MKFCRLLRDDFTALCLQISLYEDSFDNSPNKTFIFFYAIILTFKVCLFPSVVAALYVHSRWSEGDINKKPTQTQPSFFVTEITFYAALEKTRPFEKSDRVDEIHARNQSYFIHTQGHKSLGRPPSTLNFNTSKPHEERERRKKDSHASCK